MPYPMLSRVADSLYWMSRYMERTDGLLRMLKVNYASSQETMGDFTWRPILTIFTYLEDERIREVETQTRQVLRFMVTDRENPNSVFNVVTRSRENARSVQDNITNELWQCLNEFYHLVRKTRVERSLNSGDAITMLDELIRQSMLYYGIVETTMFRGEGLSFINLGKYLERASQSAGILDTKFSNLSYDLDRTTDTMYWKYLLLSISGYSLYLKSYRSGFEARNILDQSIFNINFPRSIIYALQQIERYFERLKESSAEEDYNRIHFMIGRLYSKVRFSNVQSVSQVGLHDFLIDIKRELFEIGQALNKYYFAYT